jgi:hypothetical protein
MAQIQAFQVVDGTLTGAKLADNTLTFAKLNLSDNDIPVSKVNITTGSIAASAISGLSDARGQDGFEAHQANGTDTNFSIASGDTILSGFRTKQYVKVYVNGLLQGRASEDDTYSIDTDYQGITFASAPSNGAIVEIEYYRSGS